MKTSAFIAWHLLLLFAGFWAGMPDAVNGMLGINAASSPAKTSPAVAAPTESPVLTGLRKRTQEGEWSSALDLVPKLSTAEMPVALQATLAMASADHRRKLVGPLFQAWAKLDRNAALAAARSLASPQLRFAATGDVLGEWLKSDEKAALQWVASLDSDSVLQEEMIDLLLARSSTLADADYAAWASGIGDPFLRVRSIQRVAARWMQSNAPEAIDWILTLEPAGLREQLLQHSPADPFVLIEKLLGSKYAQQHADALATQLGLQTTDQVESVLQWLSLHNGQAELQRACHAVGVALIQNNKDLSSLRATAAGLSAGALRDAFVCGAVDSLTDAREFDSAIALLADAGPCIERYQSFSRLGRELAQRNRQRAQAWMETLTGTDREAAMAGFNEAAEVKQ